MFVYMRFRALHLSLSLSLTKKADQVVCLPVVLLPKSHSPGRSFQQKNPSTPSMLRASSSSMLRIRAWALLETTAAACSSSLRGGMSSTYTASPVACLKAEAWVMGRPMGSRLGWLGGTCQDGGTRIFIHSWIYLFNYSLLLAEVKRYDFQIRCSVFINSLCFAFNNQVVIMRNNREMRERKKNPISNSNIRKRESENQKRLFSTHPITLT